MTVDGSSAVSRGTPDPTTVARRGLGRHAGWFLVVGGTAFVVDAGSLFALYDGAGAPLWLATTAGFWLSYFVTFFGNKYLTFRSAAGARRQVVRHTALVGVNYVLTLALVSALVALGLPALGAKVVSTALLTVLNFFSYRQWVFRD